MKQPTDWFSKLSYLMLETNSTCNLQCVTCSREHLVKSGLRPKKLLTEKELHAVLQQVRSCPIKEIKFQGLSEPMLHPKFHELAEIMRSYFPDAFVMISTNLQYNIEKSPFFETLPLVNMAYLSIDGAGETYEKLRKGAHYETLLTNLEILDARVTDLDRKKLFINFTLTPENYLELEEIYGLKEQFSLAGVRINLAQNWIENEANPHVFTPEILKYARKFKSDVKGVAGWNYENCFWPFTGVVIDVYGDVRQCVINTTQTPVGNVYKTPLREIYNNSPVLINARQTLKTNCAPSQCRNCDYKNLSPHLEKVLYRTVEHAAQH